MAKLERSMTLFSISKSHSFNILKINNPDQNADFSKIKIWNRGFQKSQSGSKISKKFQFGSGSKGQKSKIHNPDPHHWLNCQNQPIIDYDTIVRIYVLRQNDDIFGYCWKCLT